ncbi:MULTISPECIES: Rpn family recombination-promoting nuclease/putative transposase [Lactobacillus]|uniref:Rpn family recombination-promoting nuclease/putative transposase n=1 Tax=Lactobacillus TaxID=1578 RepID=UPI001F1EDEC6|nr:MULTISPECIES: Rpn family recombination-promoting nuclease/putative transposase [Lactobacillus]
MKKRKQINVKDLLGITDDIMFQNVMKDPVNCRNLLHEILPELDIQELEVHTQERISVNGKEKTAVLDVWVKDSQGKLYDLEMQVSDREGLDQRARFYMYKLMEDSLLKGMKYPKLPPAYVIFLLPFDPKGKGLKQYSFVYTCREIQSVALNDQSEIIYLNRRGTKGTVSEGLKGFLKLMNGEETSNSPFITRIKDTMEIYRRTKEWKKHAMNTEQLLEMTTRQVKEETAKKLNVTCP